MVKFGKRRIGNGNPCFITFEAGATHDGVNTAKKLIKYAADAGADAIKFQIFDPDRLVADKKMPFSYDVLIDRDSGKMETVTEPLYDILCRRYLKYEEWKEIKSHSDSLGLAFFATVGFEEDVKLLETLGCDSIKIASSDVNHWPLIKLVARTGMCIQLDTGNATIGEIEKAVEVCRSEQNDNIIIHNCPSGYPARLESINLKMIPSLKMMFPDFPIAFSDHSPGWEMDVAAVAIGANLIEKTITLDRTTRSAEHYFSLEPADMKEFIQTIRDIETAMGKPLRILHQEEYKKRLNTRRSAFLKRSVIKGDNMKLEDIEFRRPGFGISPDKIESMLDAKYRRNLPVGHLIMFSDLE